MILYNQRRIVARFLFWSFFLQPMLQAADTGYGFLKVIDNQTNYPLSITLDGPTIHDQFPVGTKVAIFDKQLNKYCVAVKDTVIGADGKPQTGAIYKFVALADAVTDATAFTVKRRTLPDLTDYLGFTCDAVQGSTLQIDPSDKIAKFVDPSFDAADAAQAHWKVVRGTIVNKDDGTLKYVDDVEFVNRSSGGTMHPYTGIVPRTKEVATSFLWGINEYDLIDQKKAVVLAGLRAATQTAFDAQSAGDAATKNLLQQANDTDAAAKASADIARAKGPVDAEAYKNLMKLRNGNGFKLKAAHPERLSGDWYIKCGSTTTADNPNGSWILGMQQGAGAFDMWLVYNMAGKWRTSAKYLNRLPAGQGDLIKTGMQLAWQNANWDPGYLISIRPGQGNWGGVGAKVFDDWEQFTIQTVDKSDASSNASPKQANSEIMYGDKVVMGRYGFSLGVGGYIIASSVTPGFKRNGGRGDWYGYIETGNHDPRDWDNTKIFVFTILNENGDAYHETRKPGEVFPEEVNGKTVKAYSDYINGANAAADKIIADAKVQSDALRAQAAARASSNQFYRAAIGGNSSAQRNSVSTLTFPGQTTPAISIDAKTDPNAAITPQQWEKYRVRLDGDGTFSVWKNDRLLMQKKAPTPISGVKYVGLGCGWWPWSFRNVMIDGKPVPELTNELRIVPVEMGNPKQDKTQGHVAIGVSTPLSVQLAQDSVGEVTFDAKGDAEALIVDFMTNPSALQLKQAAYWQSYGQPFAGGFGAPANEVIVAADKVTLAPKGTGSFMSLAVISSQEVYAVDTTGALSQWDGSAWSTVAIDPCYKVFARKRKKAPGQDKAQNDVFIIKKDGRKVAQLVDGAWQDFPTPNGEAAASIAFQNSAALWLVTVKGTPGNQQYTVYKYDGVKFDKQMAGLENGLSQIVATTDIVAGIDFKNRILIFNADTQTWAMLPFVQGITAQAIAVWGKNAIWVVGSDGYLYFCNGATWKKFNQRFTVLSAGNIIDDVSIDPLKVSGMSTLDVKKDDKGTPLLDDKGAPKLQPYAGGDDAKFRFEIIALGGGGGFPAKTKNDLANIPAIRNPLISGFGEETYPQGSGTSIKLNPLLGSQSTGGGVAWIEQSLPVPNKATITFRAKAEDGGGVQIVLGNQKSLNYEYRVIFGANGNSNSIIMKKGGIRNMQQTFDKVYEINPPNPLAVVPVGVFTQFWVSYDEGLILAGMGNPGENIVMAWRDPSPGCFADDPKAVTNVTRLGFASDSTPVTYSEMVVTNRVVATSPVVYKTSTDSIAAASGGKYTWSTLPFRAAGRGAVAFDMQGKEQGIVTLAPATTSDSDSYKIIFGAIDPSNKDLHNAGILIERWDARKQRFVVATFLGAKNFPRASLDPTRPRSFWISYEFGKFMIGQGTFGQNVIMAYQDPKPLDGINFLGFGSGADAVAVQNLHIAAPLQLQVEAEEEDYDQKSNLFDFSSSWFVITPFRYKVTQGDQTLEFIDLVTGSSYYNGPTPQQDAEYSFLLSFLTDGSPKLQWYKSPENKVQTAKVKALADAAADTKADLASMKADMEAQLATTKAENIKTSATEDADTTLKNAQDAIAADKNIKAATALTDATVKRLKALQAATDAKALAEAEREYSVATAVVTGLTAGADVLQEAGGVVGGMGADPVTSLVAMAAGTAMVTAAIGMKAGAVADQAQADKQKAVDAYSIALQIADGKTSLTQQELQLKFADAQAALIANAQKDSDAAGRIALAIKAKAERAYQAQLEAVKLQKQYALKQAASALALTKQKNALAADAPRSDSSYVYQDTLGIGPKASTDIPDSVKAGKAAAIKLIQQAAGITPSTQDAIDRRRKLYQQAVNFVNHYYVTDGDGKTLVKDPLIAGLRELTDAYNTFIEKGVIDPVLATGMMGLLGAARGDVYLLDPKNDDDANVRGDFLNKLGKIGNKLIRTKNKKGFTLPALYGEYIWLPAAMKLFESGEGSVAFEAQGGRDLFVSFARSASATRNTGNPLYETEFGAKLNSVWLVRIKSLDKPVAELAIGDNPDLQLNSNDYEPYWVSVRKAGDKAVISMGKGEWGKNKAFEWTDPYPTTLRWIGLSTWDTSAGLRNVMAGPPVESLTPSARAAAEKTAYADCDAADSSDEKAHTDVSVDTAEVYNKGLAKAQQDRAVTGPKADEAAKAAAIKKTVDERTVATKKAIDKPLPSIKTAKTDKLKGTEVKDDKAGRDKQLKQIAKIAKGSKPAVEEDEDESADDEEDSDDESMSGDEESSDDTDSSEESDDAGEVGAEDEEDATAEEEGEEEDASDDESASESDEPEEEDDAESSNDEDADSSEDDSSEDADDESEDDSGDSEEEDNDSSEDEEE